MKSYSPESSDTGIGRLFLCLRSRRVHTITVVCTHVGADMKRSALLFFFSLLIYLSGGLINVTAQESLAVLDTITDEQVETSVQVPVTEKLIEIFINRTDYRVIDRTDITSVLEEQNSQLSGMVKTEEIREVGRYLGADYICLAKVSLVGQTYF